MNDKRDVAPRSQPGRRARKKEETRQRIAQAAKELFLERGFAATTVEEIARKADISVRSFFDYFPAKEDVALAWHDAFQSAFIENVLKRPPHEASIVAAQKALIEALAKYDVDDVRSHAILWQENAIKARDELAYAVLERDLAAALTQRATGAPDALSTRLVAMVIVGSLRVASEIQLSSDQPERAASRVGPITRLLQSEIGKLDGDV